MLSMPPPDIEKRFKALALLDLWDGMHAEVHKHALTTLIWTALKDLINRLSNKNNTIVRK